MKREKTLFEEGVELFMQREFQKAQEKFSHLLYIDPQNKAALMGMMLCDLCQESEEEALALLDYYEVLKEEEESAEEAIMEMIRNSDEIENEMNDMFLPYRYRQMMEGISYEDFLRFVKERGSFKKAYEDIRYSTKVIITKKEDFFDFIENLIAYGYEDLVYSYLEDALKLYPADRKIEQIVKKLENHDR